MNLSLDYTSLLMTVATLFLLLAAGFIAGKREIIDKTSTEKISSLIVRIGQPMLLVGSVIRYEYSAEMLKKGLWTLLLSFGMHLFMLGIATVCSSFFRDLDEKKISRYLMVFANCGFIGFPIIESLLGPEGCFCGAFYVMGFQISTWTIGILVLAKGRDDIKLTPKKIFINHATVAGAIAILLYCIPAVFPAFKMPQFLIKATGYAGDMCTPLSLLIAGALISMDKLKYLVASLSNIVTVGVKLLVQPLVACFVLKLIGLPEYFIIFGTIMAAMPCASVGVMFGTLYNVKPKKASQMVGLSTILCSATVPVVVLIAEKIITLW